MQDFGYKVYPINPFAIGETINGETVIGSLDDIEDLIGIADYHIGFSKPPVTPKHAPAFFNSS